MFLRGTAAFRTALAAILSLAPGGLRAAEVRVAVTLPGEVDAWNARIEALTRAGSLHVRQERVDTLLPAREHTRLRQLHRGVPVLGGELVRQGEGSRTISLFGSLFEDIAIDVIPTLTADQALDVVERLAGVELGTNRLPELVVLPRDEGGYGLAWRTRAFSNDGDQSEYFIDARTGALLRKQSILRHQAAPTSAVGLGKGVLGDDKKMSASALAGTSGFVSLDVLRPPSVVTLDLKGDLGRLLSFLNGTVSLRAADLASDSDNTWTDGAVVDSHSYAGYTYDYYFKRFGRRGLDNADIEIVSVVHPVRREDFGNYSSALQGLFYLNAFYAGDGVMVYGEGLPAGRRDASGHSWNFVAGALDVVTHELTHGVTDYSSGLFYQGESGALNESFSDMMATGAEFFFQPPGSGSLQADYRLGEDVITPGGLRSMQDPTVAGDPDHYSVRFRGTSDNGGVHINSGIPNHVFYLAIEGGRNRVSGLTVSGVGSQNREQIEKAMYRAFTFMMPPRATFADARRITIQSARDLYGSGSAAERALTQAWDAVGVS